MSKTHSVYSNIHIRNTFYSEVAIGVSANALLLVFHIHVCLLRQKPRLTDLPIGLLALTNLVILLITAFIAADNYVAQGTFWDDTTCKSLFFLFRMMRGLSICTTSLLSVLQAITLSPTNSCLAKFKYRSSYHYLYSLLLLWALYASITSHPLISTVATLNLTSDNFMYLTKSCSVSKKSHHLRHALPTLLTIRETFFMGLITISGIYMSILLCRHKKRSRFLYHTKLSSKASPEQRATWTILLLLIFFMFMSILYSICSYVRNVRDDNPVLYYTQLLVCHGYAAVSPLVFISTEKRIISFFRSVCRGQ